MSENTKRLYVYKEPQVAVGFILSEKPTRYMCTLLGRDTQSVIYQNPVRYIDVPTDTTTDTKDIS